MTDLSDMSLQSLRDSADGAIVVLLDEAGALGAIGAKLAESAAAVDVGLAGVAVRDCWWTERSTTDELSARDWLLRECEKFPGPLAIAGCGLGGQGALTAAFEHPERFAAVAAIAPACDLGRWYDRSPSLQALFDSAEQARQWEAPLRLNPLRRPRSIWVGCDPRDRACGPSSLRVVTKLTSSGVPVEHDLKSEVGQSRLDYLVQRRDDWIGFLAEALRHTEPRLPILG